MQSFRDWMKNTQTIKTRKLQKYEVIIMLKYNIRHIEHISIIMMTIDKSICT